MREFFMLTSDGSASEGDSQIADDAHDSPCYSPVNPSRPTTSASEHAPTVSSNPPTTSIPAPAPHSALTALWGQRGVAYLEHRAAPFLTLLITLPLLHLTYPHSVGWAVAQAALVLLTLHAYVPFLYRRVYLQAVAELRALAAERGVALCPRTACAPLHPTTARQFAAFALSCMNTPPLRGMFALWLTHATLFGPLSGLLRTGRSNHSWAGLLGLAAFHATLFLLRERAAAHGRLLHVQRLQGLPFHICCLYWISYILDSWRQGAQQLFLPAVLQRPSGPLSWAAVLAGFLLLAAIQGLTTAPPLREVVAYRAVHGVMFVLGGWLAVTLGSGQLACQWVTWALIELPACFTFLAARVWLETVMLKRFLCQHVPVKLE